MSFVDKMKRGLATAVDKIPGSPGGGGVGFGTGGGPPRMSSEHSQSRSQLSQSQSADSEHSQATKSAMVAAQVSMERKARAPTVDDEALIAKLPPVFFEKNFDAVKHIATNLPENLNTQVIQAQKDELFRCLQIYSSRLSTLVMDNHKSFVQELHRVSELQKELALTTYICRTGRRNLSRASDGVNKSGLEVLVKHRKLHALTGLLKALSAVQGMQNAFGDLNVALEASDFPTAIELCQKMQHTAQTHKQFTCVADMSYRLKDTYEQIEDRLDEALKKVANDFDVQAYEKVLTAYSLLGKSQRAIDQVHIHFAEAVADHSQAIALRYAQQSVGSNATSRPINKMLFKELCSLLEVEKAYLPCLVDLCTAMCNLMYNYHSIAKWHTRHQFQLAPANGSVAPEATSASADRPSFGIDLKKKLEHGRRSMWEDIQRKLSLFVLAKDLSSFKFESFIQVLDIVNRLIEIGDGFGGQGSSTSLKDSLKQKSALYFGKFHRSQMADLRVMLEHESWFRCPVHPSFSALNLKEFYFLRANAIRKQSAPTHSTGLAGLEFFENYSTNGKTNPFEAVLRDAARQAEDIGMVDLEDGQQPDPTDARRRSTATKLKTAKSKDEDDEDERLKGDFIDENDGSPLSNSQSRPRTASSAKDIEEAGPIVSLATLNYLRVIGRYIQMMDVLKPIVFDVMVGMSQIFDYYMYSVYLLFGVDTSGSLLNQIAQTRMSPKLRATLTRLQRMADRTANGPGNPALPGQPSGPGQPSQPGAPGQHHPANGPQSAGQQTSAQTPQGTPVPAPQPGDFDGMLREGGFTPPSIQPHVTEELANAATLFGLPERTVGIESLMYLHSVLQKLKPKLQSTIPQAHSSFLTQFYAQTVDVVPDLHILVYQNIGGRVIDFGKLLRNIEAVKWGDFKDMPHAHNNYIDQLVSWFSAFSSRLSDLGRSRVPAASQRLLWEELLLKTMDAFVEGFARVKRCSTEGRALMQLDFRTFLQLIERITAVRPIPNTLYVENYIRAYYLANEKEMEEWIRTHFEYSIPQVASLVNCAILPNQNKKLKARFLTMLDEMDKRR
ncbi:hypothetical protein CAOG_008840 [Capsaspora owczarzaki ATCC 30864]|uniref:Uncharacterized protein n=1 Tax=Capsaspora owczarzaki (strain ATCC 30864) TaxID=595528 RepID=A0A0D2VSX5_CAPO3|nr:hypothetical protein CAOG_008840 [Capsaspora owczarzaki ATCC 30864]